MPPDQAGTFGALRIPNFRMLFAGTVLSFTAFFMSTLVQGYVAYELEGLNVAVGTAVFGQGLGMMLIGPIGGAYADRLPKRLVIAIGQSVSAGSLAVLAVRYANGTITVPNLAFNSFVMGAAFAFLGPARQALVVDLVPDSLRGNAMTLTNVSNTTSRLLGPAVAGIFLRIDSLGPAVAYWTMAGLYLGSAMLLAFLPKSVVREGVGDTHVLTDLREGLTYAWRHVRLRNLLIFFVSVMLVGFPHVTLMNGWLDTVGQPREDVAIVAIFSAIGAFAASLSLARFADADVATRIYSWMAIGFGFTLMVFALAPTYEVGLVAIVLVGATSGGFHALNGAVTAKVTEVAFMGRVMSLNFLAFAGFSLISPLTGRAGDLFGVNNVLFGMGVGVLAISLVMFGLVERDRRAAAELQSA